ncbi:MAG: YcgL domain-containing protein [Rhodanobacter sp.]
MQCFVYASTRKPDTYVWLAVRDETSVLPESLMLLLGELHFVLEVQLDDQRRLPVEDAEVVMEHLRTQRWHLQLPPSETLATATQAPMNEPLRDGRDERES